MSRDHNLKGERYVTCDLCGFDYRLSETAINAGGLRVCKERDLDEGKWDPVYVPWQTNRLGAEDYGVLLQMDEGTYNGNSELGEVCAFDFIPTATTDVSGVYGVVTAIPDRRI